MSYLIEKPKRSVSESRRRFDDIRAFISPSTLFTFQVDQLLESCATCLKAHEQVGFLRRLTATTTTVDIAWEDAITYRFYIRKRRGRDTPILATGFLTAVSENVTLARGHVEDQNWLSILSLVGIIAFVVVTQMPAAPLFLMLFVVVVLVNFYASTTERHRFIDYIKETMAEYCTKRKR
jgi:hypothetical protein